MVTKIGTGIALMFFLMMVGGALSGKNLLYSALFLIVLMGGAACVLWNNKREFGTWFRPRGPRN